MNTTTNDLADVLNSLIETCKDGHAGFHSAAEDVKNPDLKALFTTLAAQRQDFTGQLQALVRSLGGDTEKTGSLVGALHRGWIDLKAAVSSGDEHAILAECERGEDSAVAAYRGALEHAELSGEIRTVVEQQSASVQAAHDRVRDLRDRSKA